MIEVRDEAMRAVVRLSGEYTLDWVTMAGERLGGDVLLGIVFLALWRANMRDPRRDAEVNGLDPAEGTPRTPVSGRALADSLSLPRETVRRYAIRLEAAGLCRRMDSGLVVPEGVMSTPQARRLSEAMYASLRRLLDGLAELTGNPEGEALAAGKADLALCLAGDYVLRRLDHRAADVSEGRLVPAMLVFQVILQANIRHLIDDPVLQVRFAGEPPPDELRRPISIRAVAQALGMSREMARHHVALLMENDYAQRVRGGLIVPRRVFQRPDIEAATRLDLAHQRRLLSQLRDYGVLVAA